MINYNGVFKFKGTTVVVETNSDSANSVYLSGGSNRDKELFAQCVQEFFGGAKDQRSLLVKLKNHKMTDEV